MKTEFVRFLFPLSVLLAAGALEETLPKVVSVGFPFLLTATLILSARSTRTEAVVLAVLAGLVEDALGGLPLATTASFLVVAALVVTALPSTRFAPIVAYPLYQFWLVVWTSLPAGELWNRLLVSIPLAALTVWCLRPALLFCERRFVADEV